VRFYVARALERLTGTNQGRPADAWRNNLSECGPAIELWQAWWQSHRTTYGRPGGDSTVDPAAAPPAHP
jgi:hypothetical protein